MERQDHQLDYLCELSLGAEEPKTSAPLSVRGEGFGLDPAVSLHPVKGWAIQESDPDCAY